MDNSALPSLENLEQSEQEQQLKQPELSSQSEQEQQLEQSEPTSLLKQLKVSMENDHLTSNFKHNQDEQFSDDLGQNKNRIDYTTSMPIQDTVSEIPIEEEETSTGLFHGVIVKDNEIPEAIDTLVDHKLKPPDQSDSKIKSIGPRMK